MQLKIVTIYSNIDSKFLTDFIGRAPPQLTSVMGEMMSKGKSEWSSKDPESDCCATTTYEIVKEEG